MSLPTVSFSEWVRWQERTGVDGIQAPGVYVLARFVTPTPGEADPLAREVVYIGETSARTLRERWNEFSRSAFEGKFEHSGGRTYLAEYGDDGSSLFVAAFPVANMGKELRPLYIRHVERKLILDYAVRWGNAPRCNRR